ncbi:hypothetical protein OAA15_00670 [bacterium]|nr:hypothetical protein [bacterium]
MKKIINTFTIAITTFISVLFPIQQQNISTTLCCVSCAMKKEDKIEVVIDESEEIEA